MREADSKKHDMPECDSSDIKLSICIATYNRGQYICATLDSMTVQLDSRVEVVVVDGASPDNTSEVMARYVSMHPEVKYYRELENSGVDRDYDKAVAYAKGEFCWLMTDDDLVQPGAILRILEAINDNIDLLIVNSEVRSVDLTDWLAVRLPSVKEDRIYGLGDEAVFFRDTAKYLSFIGAVVVRRSVWMARDRASYFGTLFVHVGVIFQHPPIARVKVISEPLISIRLGNAMWSPRGFEIWMFKWPQLVWSFPDFSNEVKARICPRDPWKSVMRLFYFRAICGYTIASYRQFLHGKTHGLLFLMQVFLAVFPLRLANLLSAIYCVIMGRSARMALYELSRSQSATWLSRLMYKRSATTVTE